jgi:putative transposase
MANTPARREERVGHCTLLRYNALCESFFASLECELLDRYIFKSQSEARLAVFRYIEGWYNPHRRHSALD